MIQPVYVSNGISFTSQTISYSSSLQQFSRKNNKTLQLQSDNDVYYDDIEQAAYILVTVCSHGK